MPPKLILAHVPGPANDNAHTSATQQKNRFHFICFNKSFRMRIFFCWYEHLLFLFGGLFLSLVPSPRSFPRLSFRVRRSTNS